MMHVIPSWTDPSGMREGPLYPAASSQAEVGRQITQALRDARRGKGADVLIVVMDDMTGRAVARYRPKVAA